MKPEKKRKILAVIAILLGVYWLWAGRGFLLMEALKGEFLPWFATVMFMVSAYVAMFALIGVTAIFSGIELYREPAATAARRIIVVALAFVGFIVAGWLMDLGKAVIADQIVSSGILFATAFFIVMVYPAITRRLFSQLGIELPEEKNPKIGRSGLILLAWALWIFLSSVADVAFSERGIASFFALFGPVAISYGAYRYAVKKLGLRQRRKHLYAFERQGIEPVYPPGAKQD